MRFVIGAAVALTAVSAASAGLAQDMSWSGPYVGAQAGWGWRAKNNDESIRFDTNRDGTFEDRVNTAAGANAFSPGFCDGRATSPSPADRCRKDKGGVEFGARAGYDMQMGSIVIGGLVEASRTDVQDAVTAYSTTPAFYTMDRTLKGVGAVRARAGLAMSDTLVYATGGAARGQIRHTFSTSNTANSFPLTKDKWSNGYQLGGGVEHRFAPNLSLGLEYIYTRLKDDDFGVTAAGPAPAGNPFLLVNAGGTDFRRSQERFKTHSVRLTTSYRF